MYKKIFAFSILMLSIFPILSYSSPSSSYNAGYSSPSGYLSLTGSSNTFAGLINNKIIGSIMNPLVALIVAAAVIVFLYGVFKFVRAEDDKGKEEGRSFILWGIVGLFVMVSMWGLVNVLSRTFNLNNNANITTIR